MSESGLSFLRICISFNELDCWWIQICATYCLNIGRTELFTFLFWIVEWASCQIRKIAGCACAGNAGNVFPRHWLQRKTLVSDPGMHHGTCVTHVPWCMSGSLVPDGGENVPGIPGACALAIFRIWQEAHGVEIWTGTLWGLRDWSVVVYFRQFDLNNYSS